MYEKFTTTNDKLKIWRAGKFDDYLSPTHTKLFDSFNIEVAGMRTTVRVKRGKVMQNGSKGYNGVSYVN